MCCLLIHKVVEPGLVVAQVTTMRSKSSVKPEIPLGTDSVDKLEGLGARTKINLSNVRACVRHIDSQAVATVPKEAPNKIVTGLVPKPHQPHECVKPDLWP